MGVSHKNGDGIGIRYDGGVSLRQGSVTYGMCASPSNFQWHIATNYITKSEPISITTQRRYSAVSILLFL